MADSLPLSAYNIVQEATYRPNDSLPSLPFSNILPSILQNPAGDFTPQLLTVGDVLILNNSMFNYTISEAFDDPGMTTSIFSFPYYNNPLSDNCDVTNITLNLVVKKIIKDEWYPQPQLSGSITCRIPGPFYLTWSGFPPKGADATWDEMQILPSLLMEDFDIEDFSAIFQNLFQVVYHLVRLDLGVILDNQIYNSPQMFNCSIADIDRPGVSVFCNSLGCGWVADIARGATSNASIMAQWQTDVEFFETSDRVPVMEYLRSIPRIKPLGSAITSVFVSTFAMLSVLWTIFSVIAGALAGARNGKLLSNRLV
ncbi:hypothetical protein K438DRAFT_2031924 [Mycena galopus ATCC 62051]|nr:hypothetical protein K438DRAFT_2031924 [Mycena galopus ATCC 62051]